MKFRIIASIVVVVLLIVLTFIFAGGSSTDTENVDGTQTEVVQ